MDRKVIKQGNDTLTITLPRTWARKFSIKAGDQISVNERENNLVLSASQHPYVKETELNISYMTNPLVWRYFSSAYRLGSDSITLQFDESEKMYDSIFSSTSPWARYALEYQKLTTMEMIRDLVNRFIGMEIIDHQKNYCQIKDIGVNTNLEFDTILTRTFKLIQQMNEQISDAVEKKNYEQLTGTVMIDSDIDRLTDFCMRMLNKKGYKEYSKTTIMYSIVVFLELIGDEYKQIARKLHETKQSNGSLKEIMKKTYLVSKAFNETFFKFNLDNVKKLQEQIETRKQEIEGVSIESIPILISLNKLYGHYENALMLRIDLGEV